MNKVSLSLETKQQIKITHRIDFKAFKKPSNRWNLAGVGNYTPQTCNRRKNDFRKEKYMFSLSKESEQELSQGVLTLIDTFLKSQDKVSQKTLGLRTAKQLKDELDIKDNTLKRFEKNGLKRYQPPLEDTRKVYYKVSDILIFLGADN